MSIARSSRIRDWLWQTLRWTIAFLIVAFLSKRLAADWPTVQTSLERLQWGWMVGSMIPGLGYFLFRILSWQSVLSSLGVQVPTHTTARVWMNSEIIRYIPGNIWSVLGRMAQADRVRTDKTIMFSSMVLEAYLLVAAAAGLSALLLISYPQHQFPGRTLVLTAAALFLVVSALGRGIPQRVVQVLFRITRRTEDPPRVNRMSYGFAYMILAWISFALFQVFVTWSLGVELKGVNTTAVAGIFLVSWVIGYVSFITPSGLGVREAALAIMFSPFTGVAEAITLAVVSRVALIAVELVGLALVNVPRDRAS